MDVLGLRIACSPSVRFGMSSYYCGTYHLVRPVVKISFESMDACRISPSYPSPHGALSAPLCPSARPALTDDSETGPAAMSISRPCSVAWNYETIARDPEVSEAFREFAHRALCQESVDFLEEVTRCAYYLLCSG